MLVVVACRMDAAWPCMNDKEGERLVALAPHAPADLSVPVFFLSAPGGPQRHAHHAARWSDTDNRYIEGEEQPGSDTSAKGAARGFEKLC